VLLLDGSDEDVACEFAEFQSLACCGL